MHLRLFRSRHLPPGIPIARGQRWLPLPDSDDPSLLYRELYLRFDLTVGSRCEEEGHYEQTRWMVITFVVLYFAGAGGMLGVAANAGWSWTLASVILFLISAVLAFVQRAVTGY